MKYVYTAFENIAFWQSYVKTIRNKRYFSETSGTFWKQVVLFGDKRYFSIWDPEVMFPEFLNYTSISINSNSSSQIIET